ncbi:SH3 domain-containing protein [Comamonas sp.]|uniref:SH3 domain-containing protein n=1 Tax=Comamonas sp. TaxID=34028 RepID=UPI003A92D563
MLCNHHRAPRWIAAGAMALAALTTTLAPAAAQAQEFVSIKGSTANVRATPSTRAPVRWELSKGYPLQVIKHQGSWLRVKDNEATLGWVHQGVTGKAAHMVVTAPTANLRAGPGQNHRRVARLEQGDVLRTLKKQGGWVQVQRSNGASGWVAGNLVWGW